MNNSVKKKYIIAYLCMVFLNAAIDIGHKILMQNTLFKMHANNSHTLQIMSTLLNMLLLLPFILAFSPAGFLSDRFAKTKVLRITAASAIPITLLLTLCYYQGWFTLSYLFTFVLSAQAAFNSPAKYGFIRETFGQARLAQVNAATQTMVIMGILMSSLLFGVAFHFLVDVNTSASNSIHSHVILQHLAPAGFILIGFSLFETLLTFMLPTQPAAEPDSTYNIKKDLKGKYALATIRYVTSNKIIFSCVIGLSLFWGINQLLLAEYPAYLASILGSSNTLPVSITAGVGGIGILFGALYSGKISRGFIETGIIPIAAFGITVSLFFLFHTTHLTLIYILFFLLGSFGGMLVVPLSSLVQFHANKKQLGKIIAANNFFQYLTMATFLITSTLVIMIFNLNVTTILMALTILTAVATAVSFKTLPQSMIRFMLFFIISKFYKVSVKGLDNLPNTGGVLLLGNHISYLDWAFLQIASPRPMGFVIEEKYYNHWFFNLFLRHTDAIPITSKKSRQALIQIRNQLKAGKVVAMFPEGRLTLNGQVNYFHSGFERAVRQSDAIITPFYLIGPWGSALSRANKKYKQLSRKRWHRAIHLTFGESLSNRTKANELKQIIQNLSVPAWKHYHDNASTLSASWYDNIKKNASQICFITPNGRQISQIELFSMVKSTQKSWRPLLAKTDRIGILLPNGTDTIITLVTLISLGKTIVILNPQNETVHLLDQIQKSHTRDIIMNEKLGNALDETTRNSIKSKLTIHTLPAIDFNHSSLNITQDWLKIKLSPRWLIRQKANKKNKIKPEAFIVFTDKPNQTQTRYTLTDKNIITNTKQIVRVMDPTSNDTIISTAPLHSTDGIISQLCLSLIEPLPTLIQQHNNTSQELYQSIYKNKATVWFSDRKTITDITADDKVSSLLLQSIEKIFFNQQATLQSEIQEFEAKFKKELYSGFSSTPSVGFMTLNIPDKLNRQDWHIQVGNKTHSVGLPLPGFVIKIINPKTLTECKPEEKGLVLIRGYYQSDANLSLQPVIIDEMEWVPTTLEGHLDNDGFLFLAAKKHDT